MANFTVRVELHGAAASDYFKLHEEMQKAEPDRGVYCGSGDCQICLILGSRIDSFLLKYA